MKKKLLLLAGTLLFSVCIVAFLYYYTTEKSFLNNFVRKFPFHILGPSKLVDVKYSSFYFAGASGERIFLGNAKAPLYVFSADPALTDTVLLKLIPTGNELYLKTPQINVNRDRIYLFDGGTPSIYESKIGQGATLQQTSRDDHVYFTQAVAFGPSSFAIRTFDGLSRQHMLARKITADTTRLEPAPGVLKKQIDGIFCTDGTLLYNEASSMLIYVYLYRNEFICMDTSMRVLYRANTIDTTSRARIKVGSISSENKITLASPPVVVNRLSCVYKKWLFVNSALTADNENEDAAKQASVVDVYNLEDGGAYLFSLYLLHIGGERMYSFGAAHGRLFTLHNHYLVSYALNPKYFEGEDDSAYQAVTR